MLQFYAENLQMLDSALNAVMVLIWTVYLHLILLNHLRQSGTVIHIDIGAAKGARSRCLVTNLSYNPVYVQGLVADLACNGDTSRTIVTDRNEISEDDVEDPLARTNRGTLQPGETVDIGSLADIVNRARISLKQDWTPDQIDTVTVSVVAIAGQASRIVGASKTFIAQNTSEHLTFSSQSLLTHQMKPGKTREEFSRILRQQTQE